MRTNAYQLNNSINNSINNAIHIKKTVTLLEKTLTFNSREEVTALRIFGQNQQW